MDVQAGFLLGPYDPPAGLDGSREFFERHSPFGAQPQGYLIAANDHLAIAAADRPFQALVFPYVEIERIDLFPGTKERKAIVTQRQAHLSRSGPDLHVGRPQGGLRRNASGWLLSAPHRPGRVDRPRRWVKFDRSIEGSWVIALETGTAHVSLTNVRMVDRSALRVLW